MPDFSNTDDNRAEVAMLSHEVYRLTKKLEEQERRHLAEAMPDKFDPFNNPTEYKGFNGDYSKILPRIEEPAYEIPLEPDYAERKGLRKFYSIGGWCIVFQFIATFGASMLLLSLIISLLSIFVPDADSDRLMNYVKGSSILVSLNMLVYLVFNVLNSFIGMTWAKIKYTSLIRTKDFGFGKAVQYCMIGLFLWTVSIYLAMGANDIFSRYGIDILVDSDGIGETLLAEVIATIYTCIIAPITEELFYRGMLLNVFSKSNQRFAIFATALFFGFAHGNIQQFILAFLLGIFFAHITMKHGSIIPSIIVHIFVNTLSTVLSHIVVISTMLSVMAYLALIGAAIVGAILFLVFRGSNKLPATTPHQSRRGLRVAIGSVPFTGAIIIYVLYMLYILFSNR